MLNTVHSTVLTLNKLFSNLQINSLTKIISANQLTPFTNEDFLLILCLLNCLHFF